TEAGNAGMHPCRGIAWWDHRDDDRSAEALPRSSKNQIGSVDPDALKIPARRAEFTLTENARVPFHAEPGHLHRCSPRSTKSKSLHIRKPARWSPEDAAAGDAQDVQSELAE